MKVCYDLTSDMLLTTHFCTKCNFVLGSSDAPVKGKIERNCVRESEMEYYIEKFSYSGNNVRGYIREQEYAIRLMISKGASYSDWIKIAMMNARLERYSCLHHIDRDQSFIDDAFKSFIDKGYQKLAGVVSKDAPVILPKVIDRIATGEKVALVVADGMSMFDFEILSEYMDSLDYSLGGSFAMIPTITSISRQALLPDHLSALLYTQE